MHIIDNNLLKKVSKQAKESERLRMNYNLHDSLDAPVQKLLNALELGTELAIHRHKETAETYLLLKGEIKVIFFDDKKKITDEFILNPEKGNYGIDIPVGQWHTIEVLETDSVIFEVKEGPYKPITEGDILK